MGTRSRAGTVLFALLFISLAAAAAIAWEATRATRAERATAEAVLRDYAAFAAWEFARASQQELDSGLDRILGALASAERRHGAAAVLLPHTPDPDDCGCSGIPAGVQSFFHIGGDDAPWITSGEAVDETVRTVVAAAPPASRGMHQHSPIRLQLTERGQVVVWRSEREGSERVWHGFVADPFMLTPLFRKAETAAPLLPPALIARVDSQRDPGERILTVAVRDPSGRGLYELSAEASPYTGSTTLEPRLGGLVVRAALRPSSAAGLIIGGLPRSRLPIVYGLIALATVLVGVALVQVRRQIELARIRSEFVSGVSHELRTPLAQIRMFAETLLLGRVRSAEESRRSLEIILQESQRLSHLVDNVLCFSRVERGMVALNPERVDLAAFVAQFVESVQPLVRSRRATLAWQASADECVQVDSGAVRQMLLNLVDNALKYGPPGQTVTVGAARRGPVLRLWVDDEGPGVAPAERDRVWEPFWRGAGSSQGGSGIGLAIVRDLAQRHGGRVSIERTEHGGARFVVEVAELAERRAA